MYLRHLLFFLLVILPVSNLTMAQEDPTIQEVARQEVARNLIERLLPQTIHDVAKQKYTAGQLQLQYQNIEQNSERTAWGSLLSLQYQHPNTATKTALFLYPNESEAGFTGQDPSEKDLFAALSYTMSITFIRVDTQQAINGELDKIDDHHIDYLVIGGHGNGRYQKLSESESESEAKEKLFGPSFDKTFQDLVNKKLTKNAVILLHGCYSGQVSAKSLADELAEICPDKTIVAPMEPSVSQMTYVHPGRTKVRFYSSVALSYDDYKQCKKLEAKYIDEGLEGLGDDEKVLVKKYLDHHSLGTNITRIISREAPKQTVKQYDKQIQDAIQLKTKLAAIVTALHSSHPDGLILGLSLLNNYWDKERKTIESQRGLAKHWTFFSYRVLPIDKREQAALDFIQKHYQDHALQSHFVAKRYLHVLRAYVDLQELLQRPTSPWIREALAYLQPILG